MKVSAQATEEELQTEINRIRAESASTAGASLAILADETLSPTRERLRAELQRQFPQATWATYEPLAPGRDLEASAMVFGANTEFRPNLSAASTILSLDCDFLGSDEGDLIDTRGFAAGRRARKPGDKMNRLYVAEPRFSLTGTMADHRLSLRAGAAGAFLLELARQIRAIRPSAELNNTLSQAPDLPLPSGVDPAWIRECAADLVTNGNHSLVLVGRRHSVGLQALALALNSSLGSIGTTLFVQPRLSATSSSID
jgi:molybdopterin-containing oxidoreductase family iron-sulfur binding subunit